MRLALVFALAGQLTATVGAPVYAACRVAAGKASACGGGTCACSPVEHALAKCCCSTPPALATPMPVEDDADAKCPRCKNKASRANAKIVVYATAAGSSMELAPERCRCDKPSPVAAEPAVSVVAVAPAWAFEWADAGRVYAPHLTHTSACDTPVAPPPKV